MSKQQMVDAAKLISPVINWLNANFDPHTVIIIQNDRFDIYRGEMGGGIGYFKKEDNDENQGN